MPLCVFGTETSGRLGHVEHWSYCGKPRSLAAQLGFFVYFGFGNELRPCKGAVNVTLPKPSTELAKPPFTAQLCVQIKVWLLLLSALINALVIPFSALSPLLFFCCLPTVQCVRNNLSSHWQDARVPLLVPETQSLRNLLIRWFCADPFSSLAQTFAVNWSRGSRIQTELCGLELKYHGKTFPSSLLGVSCFISLYVFFALSEQ